MPAEPGETNMEVLNKIQKELKAPKGQFNSFGKYHYRNCEDILEAVKPLLGDAVLTLSDKVVQVGDRYYVEATAELSHKEETKTVTAYAREAFDKKGMDEAQITGAASSYARKYALNGLFCIDDTKDADSEAPKTEAPKATVPAAKIAPPNAVAKMRLAKKKRIMDLCDAKVIAPLSSAEDYAVYVSENTGLTLEEGNFDMIIERLESIK